MQILDASPNTAPGVCGGPGADAAPGARSSALSMGGAPNSATYMMGPSSTGAPGTRSGTSWWRGGSGGSQHQCSPGCWIWRILGECPSANTAPGTRSDTPWVGSSAALGARSGAAPGGLQTLGGTQCQCSPWWGGSRCGCSPWVPDPVHTPGGMQPSRQGSQLRRAPRAGVDQLRVPRWHGKRWQCQPGAGRAHHGGRGAGAGKPQPRNGRSARWGPGHGCRRAKRAGAGAHGSRQRGWPAAVPPSPPQPAGRSSPSHARGIGAAGVRLPFDPKVDGNL